MRFDYTALPKTKNHSTIKANPTEWDKESMLGLISVLPISMTVCIVAEFLRHPQHVISSP